MHWLMLTAALATPPAAGLYAMNTEITTQSRVPLFGSNLVLTRTRALVEVFDLGSRVEARQRTCSIDVEDSSKATTRIPDAFVQALEPLVYSVTSDAQGFRFDETIQRVGLADGEVQDTDGDGRPGATIWLDVPLFGRIDVYVVQETASVLRGSYDGTVGTGVVDVTAIRQHTVGASHPLFRVSPRLSPVNGQSHFRLERVAATTRCEDLDPQAWSALNEPRPPEH